MYYLYHLLLMILSAMCSKYNFKELPSNVKYFLTVINVPTELSWFGFFTTRLIECIEVIYTENISPEMDALLKPLLQDLRSLDLKRLGKNNEHKSDKISDKSPFYYLLVKIENINWGLTLTRCCSIFLAQLIKNHLSPNYNDHFGYSNQRLVQQLLLSPKKISGTNFNIYSVYQALDKKSSSENVTVNLVTLLGKINTDKASVTILINIINQFTKDASNNYLKPYANKINVNNTPNPLLRLPRNKDGIEEVELASYIEDDEPVRHQLLEVIGTNKTLLSSVGELAKYSRVRLSLKNHFPQIQNNVLNDNEATALYDFLLNQYNDKSEGEARFSLLLMLLLGIDISWLRYIKIVNVLPAHIEPHHIYLSKTGLYKFNTIPLKEVAHINETQTPWLKGIHNKTLTLSIPKIITHQISKYENISFGSVENETEIDKLFEKIRHHLGRRFTRDRVREFSFNCFYRETKDEVIACYLQALNNFTMPTGCYYTSINVSQVVAYQKQAFTSVFGDLVENNFSTEDGYIGSEINISINVIAVWFESLQKKIESLRLQTRSLNDLIEYHNNYVKYVSTILLITTGHRLVNDIFDDRNFIFIDDGFCFIGDKASSKENSLRIVPLCSIAIEQLKYYSVHLESLAFRVSKFDHKLALKIAYTSNTQNRHFSPFLFEIVENNEIVGIKPESLKIFWGPSFTLPKNFNRHLLSTRFHQLGLPREYINYVLGHLAAGQSPLSGTSTVKRSNWCKPILKCLETFSIELNLNALVGLKKGKKHQLIN